MRDTAKQTSFKGSRLVMGLIWGLLLAQAVACKSDEPKPIASARAPIQGAHARSEPAPTGLGEPCVTVKDCPSYLSCADEICVMPASLSDTPAEKTPLLEVFDPTDASVASFKLELAISPDEHEKGLMYRRELPDDWGMLFIYPDEGMRSFWMQNTYIPLDMIFIDARGRVVHVIAEAEPLTRTPRKSQHFARYVLELRGGRAAEVGLQTGHHIKLTHVADKYDVKP